MTKTSEDFRTKAKEHGIEWWGIHNCSICNYECGYILNRYENCEVVYDSGCDCTGYSSRNARQWDDVANQYNMQTNHDVIKKYNDFWKFDNEKDSDNDRV